MKPEPSPSERKLDAKRNNERLKLAAAFLNTLSIGVIGGAVIVPAFNPDIQPSAVARGVGLLAGVGLHILAQWLFGLLRSED